ncbi:hypothetical protein P7C70_g1821, partial [Phenoliferia sp. Uapishka_3]
MFPISPQDFYGPGDALPRPSASRQNVTDENAPPPSSSFSSPPRRSSHSFLSSPPRYQPYPLTSPIRPSSALRAPSLKRPAAVDVNHFETRARDDGKTPKRVENEQQRRSEPRRTGKDRERDITRNARRRADTQEQLSQIFGDRVLSVDVGVECWKCCLCGVVKPKAKHEGGHVQSHFNTKTCRTYARKHQVPSASLPHPGLTWKAGREALRTLEYDKEVPFAFNTSPTRPLPPPNNDRRQSPQSTSSSIAQLTSPTSPSSLSFPSVLPPHLPSAHQHPQPSQQTFPPTSSPFSSLANKQSSHNVSWGKELANLSKVLCRGAVVPMASNKTFFDLEGIGTDVKYVATLSTEDGSARIQSRLCLEKGTQVLVGNSCIRCELLLGRTGIKALKDRGRARTGKGLPLQQRSFNQLVEGVKSRNAALKHSFFKIRKLLRSNASRSKQNALFKKILRTIATCGRNIRIENLIKTSLKHRDGLLTIARRIVRAKALGLNGRGWNDDELSAAAIMKVTGGPAATAALRGAFGGPGEETIRKLTRAIQFKPSHGSPESYADDTEHHLELQGFGRLPENKRKSICSYATMGGDETAASAHLGYSAKNRLVTDLCTEHSSDLKATIDTIDDVELIGAAIQTGTDDKTAGAHRARYITTLIGRCEGRNIYFAIYGSCGTGRTHQVEGPLWDAVFDRAREILSHHGIELLGEESDGDSSRRHRNHHNSNWIEITPEHELFEGTSVLVGFTMRVAKDGRRFFFDIRHLIKRVRTGIARPEGFSVGETNVRSETIMRHTIDAEPNVQRSSLLVMIMPSDAMRCPAAFALARLLNSLPFEEAMDSLKARGPSYVRERAAIHFVGRMAHLIASPLYTSSLSLKDGVTNWCEAGGLLLIHHFVNSSNGLQTEIYDDFTTTLHSTISLILHLQLINPNLLLHLSEIGTNYVEETFAALRDRHPNDSTLSVGKVATELGHIALLAQLLDAHPHLRKRKKDRRDVDSNPADADRAHIKDFSSADHTVGSVDVLDCWNEGFWKRAFATARAHFLPEEKLTELEGRLRSGKSDLRRPFGRFVMWSPVDQKRYEAERARDPSSCSSASGHESTSSDINAEAEVPSNEASSKEEDDEAFLAAEAEERTRLEHLFVDEDDAFRAPSRFLPQDESTTRLDEMEESEDDLEDATFEEQLERVAAGEGFEENTQLLEQIDLSDVLLIAGSSEQEERDWARVVTAEELDDINGPSNDQLSSPTSPTSPPSPTSSTSHLNQTSNSLALPLKPLKSTQIADADGEPVYVAKLIGDIDRSGGPPSYSKNRGERAYHVAASQKSERRADSLMRVVPQGVPKLEQGGRVACVVSRAGEKALAIATAVTIQHESLPLVEIAECDLADAKTAIKLELLKLVHSPTSIRPLSSPTSPTSTAPITPFDLQWYDTAERLGHNTIIEVPGSSVTPLHPLSSLIDTPNQKGVPASLFSHQELESSFSALAERPKLPRIPAEWNLPYQSSGKKALFEPSTLSEAELSRAMSNAVDCAHCHSSMSLAQLHTHVSAHVLKGELAGSSCVFCGGTCAVEVVESSHQPRDHKLFSSCEHSKDHLLNPRYPTVGHALATKEDKPSSNAPLICRACPVGSSNRTITRYGAEQHWIDVHSLQNRDLGKEVLVPQAKRSGKLVQLFVAVSDEERNTVLEVERKRCVRAEKVARREQEQIQSDTNFDCNEPQYNPAPTRSGRNAFPSAPHRSSVAIQSSSRTAAPTTDGLPPPKRGRGRPRKQPCPPPTLNLPPQTSASSSGSAFGTHLQSAIPPKQQVGRPRKRPLNSSAPSSSLSNITNHIPPSSLDPSLATTSLPLQKRPRGRPRKVIAPPPETEPSSDEDDDVEVERMDEELPRLRSNKRRPSAFNYNFPTSPA